MNLLAVEIMACTGRDPSEPYHDLTLELGALVYERMDAPATPQQKSLLLMLSPGDVKASELAGDPIPAMLTAAPGNGAFGRNRERSLGGCWQESINEGWGSLARMVLLCIVLYDARPLGRQR